MKKEVILCGLFLISLFYILPLIEGQGVSVPINFSVNTTNNASDIWYSVNTTVFYRSFKHGGEGGVERLYNYAFEGERIVWWVLIRDLNGIEDVREVVVTVCENATMNCSNPPQDWVGNPLEAACDKDNITDMAFYVGTGAMVYDPNIMASYRCEFTVEPYEVMNGTYYLFVQVEDSTRQQTVADIAQIWYLNPTITVTVNNSIDFGIVNPGDTVYSSPISIRNDADPASNVRLDMFISGTDFYDPTHSHAKCPTTNRLRLNSGGSTTDYVLNATNLWVLGNQTHCDVVGNRSTEGDGMTGAGIDFLCYRAITSANARHTGNDFNRRDGGAGYVGIPYETGNKDDRAPIISSSNFAHTISYGGVRYLRGNVLAPGDFMTITFRMMVPQPCIGDFNSGKLFFWAEPI